jgi:RNA polymerase sigma-70 factor (ECF subfamily)
MDNAGEVTRLLGAVKAGDKAAEAELLELVYPELRRIARHYLRSERSGHTLQPTALVNEAYLQLTQQLDKDWQGRSHFFAVAAQLMRRILVDYARRKKAAKRDGARQQVELTDSLSISHDRLEEIIYIDDALRRLAEFDPRRATVGSRGLTAFESNTLRHAALMIRAKGRHCSRSRRWAPDPLREELRWQATRRRLADAMRSAVAAMCPP